jgi:predicted NAD/FAD-binding protein
MRRIAVVGSGIAGLAVARELAPRARVTLFEAGAWFGGHAHTVDVTLEGRTHGVDTGFLVFNERTYPNLIRLFADLGIATAASDMSFSVKAPAGAATCCAPGSGACCATWRASTANAPRSPSAGSRASWCSP